jgi:general secretion pathway protein A
MNYLDYYELAQEPFSNAPVSRFYFNSPQHSQALVRLSHICAQMKGLGILVGDIGAGKTTLARRLLDSLPEAEYEAALLVIIHSGVTASWLLKRIALQLGVDAPSEDKLTLLGQLYQRLVKIYEQGKKAIVLIDEAQMLATRELMEEFRGLLNLEVPERKLLSLIFFGLPEIEQNLKLDPPLAQRVAVKYRLDHLNAESTEAYIKHRLRLAGASRMPFTTEAVRAVHRFSGGTPRVINTLCDNALFEGYIARAPMIDHKMIERVALDLGLEGGQTPEEPKAAAPSSKPPPRPAASTAPVPPQITAAAEAKSKAMDLGEIDRYLAGLAKPS